MQITDACWQEDAADLAKEDMDGGAKRSDLLKKDSGGEGAAVNLFQDDVGTRGDLRNNVETEAGGGGGRNRTVLKVEACAKGLSTVISACAGMICDVDLLWKQWEELEQDRCVLLEWREISSFLYCHVSLNFSPLMRYTSVVTTYTSIFDTS